MSAVREQLELSAPAFEVVEGLAPRPGLIADLLDLTKPRLSALVLVTTAVGFAVAPGNARLWDLIVTVVGVAMTVAAANTLNCWLERDTDARMRRTRTRPLPAGRLSPRVALAQGVILTAISLPLIAYASNLTAAALAALALVSYVAVYTPLKRVSSVATVVGAFPGALPPLIGWVASSGHIELGGVVLFGILFLWQIPHFLALSVFLADDYAMAGLKVLPLAGGMTATRWNVLLWTVALLPVSLLPVRLGFAGDAYGVVAIVSGLAFVALGARGFRKNAGKRWAVGLFATSILYLTVLFTTLVLDARG